jgi:hypothetical protein
MPICKNDPKAKYKGNEPSPKGYGYCAHSEKVGTIKKGKDGKKWIIVETAKKIKRWVKHSIKKKNEVNKKNGVYSSIYKKHKGWKHYLIHDNGGRPFLVYISPKKRVDIYIKDESIKYQEEEYGKIYTYTKLVKSYKCKKVYIGKSPLNEMTKFSGGHGSKFDGNTILLEISKCKYIYIGEEICSFKTKQDIIKYVSPVGNNDVPYAYAIDKDGAYYLILEKAIISRMEKKYREDPYDYYYRGNLKKTKAYYKDIGILKELRMKVIHKRLW